MAEGNYDHPSYLTRQQITAYAKYSGGTAGLFTSPISDVRIRNVALVVQNSSTATETVKFYNGTTSVGQVVIASSGVLGYAGTTGDLNSTLKATTVFSAVMPTDTNLAVNVIMEMYLDPQATWTGGN